MAFDAADYRRASARLDVPELNIMAMAAVESSGETSWTLPDGRLVVPARFEAHIFGKETNYRFNASHPDLSSYTWRPELAARTRAGAWDQIERARALDRDAANSSTSFGAFQIMGFHWHRLGFPGVEAFVASQRADDDDGQMDAFAAFVDADDVLQHALKVGDFDTVETIYNGGGQGGRYAQQIRDWLASHAGVAAPQVPRPLRRGDQGADVAALQGALGIRADGDFGPATEQAVRLFQETHDLVVDGIAGTMTKRALGLVK